MTQQFSVKKRIYPSLAFLGIVVMSHSAAAQNKLHWNGEVSLGYGYDSNVTIDELDLNARTGDQYVRYEGKLALDYDISDNQDVRLSYKLSEKQYNDQEQLDLGSHFLSTGYTYKAGKTRYGFDWRYVDSELDGQDFMTLNMISPFVSGFIGKQHYLRAGITHTEKKLKSQSARDAKSNEYSLDYYYFINGLNRFIILSGKFKNENARDAEFNYHSSQLRVAYEYRFPVFALPSKVRIDFRIRQRKYEDEINREINDFREDTRQRAGASLEMELSQNLSVVLDASYVDNESDLNSLNYTESLFNVTLSYAF